ncbi:MAG TPA: DUF1036 domain-containing protein [Hyphomicrobiales bacterium]|nr:DUF1036 domain-containing protein [Hyphomicrobiales bacterium]
MTAQASALLRLLCGPAAAAAALLALPGAAHADFRLCNATASRVGVAVGYKNGANWVTEGWWNIGGSSCETLLKGPLVARYYYVYALDYDHGGEWGGAAFMCTQAHEFTIRGIADCHARGFDRTGFFEIDTRDQRSWTVQLTETPAKTQASSPSVNATPPAETAQAGAAPARTPAR